MNNAAEFFEDLRIWVLSDGKAGHLNQSLGVAEALGGDVQIIHLEKRKFGAFLSFFWPPLKVKNLPGAPWPHVVIATGSLTVPVSKWVKMQNPSTVTVQMMSPLNRLGLKFKPGGFLDFLFNHQNLNFFDVVASPVHEGLSPNEHTVVTVGAPNRITAGKLAEAQAAWQPHFMHLGEKKWAVLVGGNSKRFVFDETAAKAFAEDVLAAAKKAGAGLMVTTSRRTGDAQIKILKDILKGENVYFWNGEGENPYAGFLACADAIVATPDSTSMVSEACSTGKTVYVWGLDENMQRLAMGKFNTFYKALSSSGFIYKLGDEKAKAPEKPLDDTSKVAGFIRAHILKRLNQER